MGKSNNLQNKFKTVYERKKNLNDFLEEEHIKNIENINKIFIKRITTDFKKLIKCNIELTSYTIKTEFNRNAQELIHANLIETAPFDNQSLIIFSSNFFSVIIEVLFGGSFNFSEKTRKKIDMTSTEKFIHEKIMKLIIESYSDACKEFYLINFVNIKIFINFKKYFFNSKEIFLINCFNFNINNIEVFFGIFIPLLLIKKINKKENALKSKDQITKKNIISSISLRDIYDVELDIVVKLMSFSVSYDKLYNLSVGDVLLIQKPEKITGYLENKPIFLGNCKIFNERSVIFIEEFIKKI